MLTFFVRHHRVTRLDFIFDWQATVSEVMVRALPDFEASDFMSILAADLRQLPASFSPWDFWRRVFVSFQQRLMPNQSPEPTAVGAAVPLSRFTPRVGGGLSFFR